MKRFALYLELAAVLVASCSTKEIDIQTPLQDDVIFYATFEQPAEEGTRVYANEDLLLRWTADDRVSIFNKITYNQQYKFTGETGDYEGGFNKIGDPEFITGDEIPHVVSVYPFQRLTRVSAEEVITVTLPSEQSYAQNSFGLGANTMVSVSSGNLLKYRNVGGYLMLKLYGEGVSVSSITLKGNNGEKIAGDATVTMPLNGTPTAVMAEDATTEITLTCPEPVALGATAEESSPFWFVIPPVNFSEGFTITVNVSAGGVFRQSTTKSVTIDRNILSKMAPIEVVPIFIPEAVDLGLPSGLKWASFNLGATKPEEFGDYYAWGETMPKEDYSLSSYKWCKGGYDKLTKYCTDAPNSPNGGYNGFLDNKTVLDPEDDAAYVNLGGKWRMPTYEECNELRENCTWTWTTQNGVNGEIVTGPNGNSIFLPVAGCRYESNSYNVGSRGYFWSSSILSSHPGSAYYIFIYGSVTVEGYGRCYGFSVRPVYAE